MMKHISLIAVLLTYLFSANTVYPAGKNVTIQWFGQSCFSIITSESTHVLTDPVNFKGYRIPEGIKPDIVTVSHEHIDHNAVSAVSGSPEVLRGLVSEKQEVARIDTTIKDVNIYNVPSYHSKAMIGANAIFVFEFDSLRLAHLGDLGLKLSDSQIQAIGDVDMLMLPVGGQFTISGAEADTVVDQLHVKRIVFPMHYKTAAADFLPYSANDYVKDKQNVKRIQGNTFILDLGKLPEKREYVILDYK